MNKIIFAFFLFCNTLLSAGTPYVAQLKLEGEKTFVFTESFQIPEIVIEVLGKSEQLVIASNWSIEPALPQGLKLEIENKSKFRISGTSQKPSPLIRYTISASNNGNKVKSIPAATLQIDIKVNFMRKTLLRTGEQISIVDLSNPNNPVSLEQFQDTTVTAYGNGVFALLANRKISFLDAYTNQLINTISLPIAAYNVHFYKEHFYILGSEEAYTGEDIVKVHPEQGIVQIQKIGPTQLLMLRFHAKIFDHYLIYETVYEKSCLVIDLEDLTNIYTINANLYPLAIGHRSFAFLNTEENSISICDIDQTKENPVQQKKITINRLEISDEKTLISGPNGFILGSYDPFYSRYHLTKITKSGGKYVQQSPEFGGRKPISIAYGNGCIAALSDYEIKIFHASTNEEIFLQEVTGGKEVVFLDDHFIIEMERSENDNLMADTKNLEKGFVSFPYSLTHKDHPENIPRLYNSARNFFTYTVKDDVFIIDSEMFSIKYRFKGSYCSPVGKNYLAVVDGNTCRFFHTVSKNLVKEVTISRNISKIRISGNKVIITSENLPTLLIVDTTNDFIQQEIVLEHNVGVFEVIGNKVLAGELYKASLVNLENSEITQLNIGTPFRIIADNNFFVVTSSDDYLQVINPQNGNIEHKENVEIHFFIKVSDYCYVGRDAFSKTLVVFQLSSNNNWESAFFDMKYIRDLIFGERFVAIVEPDQISWFDMETLKIVATHNIKGLLGGTFINGKFVVRDSKKFYIFDAFTQELIGNIKTPSK